MHRTKLLWQDKNVMGIFAFLSLAYKVKAFFLVIPRNTAGPSFWRTVLMCFLTSISSQPVPGHMHPLKVPNVDFL